MIDVLAGRGFARSIEAGRGIIQDQVTIGGSALPWAEPRAFAELMLCWEMRSYHMARHHGGLTIFDRGVPDVIGYLRLMKLPVPVHMDNAAKHFRYNRRVFVAPPWPAIFKQDAERKQSLEEAEATYHAMVETYSRYGYELISLPLAPIEDRVQFVIKHLG